MNPDMQRARYPSLYQINTRVWLTELSKSLRKRATLDDIPDAELDRVAEMGFDWIWLLSVWQTGDAALARLRERLRKRGLRLMLDFVPNHMAPDHPWINEHPDYFVRGPESDLSRAPQNYCRVQPWSARVFALTPAANTTVGSS